MSKRPAITLVRMKSLLLIASLCEALLSGCQEEPKPTDPLRFDINVEDSYFPWQGHVKLHKLEVNPGDRWIADFQFNVNLDNLALQKDVVKELVFVIVGEQVYDARGKATGLNSTGVSSVFTSAGIPLTYYTGTLPVRALGSRRGSPFEGTMSFPAGSWARGGGARLKGKLVVTLPKDLPPGYYLPHVNIFAKLKGTNTPIDLGVLASHIGISDMDTDRLTLGRYRRFTNQPPPSADDSMTQAKVLPEVKVGSPATPNIPWAIYIGRPEQGVSGILPIEDRGHVGLLERDRFPTPPRITPGQHMANACLPTKVPHLELSGTYLARGGMAIPKTYFNLWQSRVKAALRTPKGEKRDLGEVSISAMGQCGPVFNQWGLPLDLQETGDYELVLKGTMRDTYGRSFRAGGTYRFTVAMPLSFSTAVKPGTNFLKGAAYPAVIHINPGVPADVRVQVSYFPNSSVSRKQEVLYQGRANRFGTFVPQSAPLRFDETGEYRSRLEVRYRDKSGTLWMGAQTSAGVIAPREPMIKLHGGKMSLSEPDLSHDQYGMVARIASISESTCPFFIEPAYSGTDFQLPYLSGDTLFVAATYPFESAVSNVLTMEVRDPQLAATIVDAYNPTKTAYNLPSFSYMGIKNFLPDVVNFSVDDFGVYRISAKHPEMLPILFRNRRGISPYLFPEENDIEAYAYLSVIRPGFQVLSLAYTESHIQPYWIISPNPIEGSVSTRPVGDLAGDMYRVMAGLVVKDKRSKKNYYDAYGSSLINVPRDIKPNSISAPGERPVSLINGREQYFLLGMDTSQLMAVGERMMLAGTVVPPVEANVQFTVTLPDGTTEILRGRSNRLGQLSPPRPVAVDIPGVYRIKVRVTRDGKSGDVAGTGDGQFFNFALPKEPTRLLRAKIPPVSPISASRPIHIPLSWPRHLKNVKITHSINMPGFVLDEGTRAIKIPGFVFPIRLDQMAIQYPFLETVHYGTGQEVLADTIVVVLYLEATAGGEKVFDAVRLVIRQGMLMNIETALAGSSTPQAKGLFPKDRIFFSDP